MKSSARNQLSGTIETIEDEGGMQYVTVACAGGTRVRALVSRASAAALKLTVGGTVVVMVKASSIMLVTDLAPLQLSAENSLEGTIKHIETGTVNNVVTLSLPGGIELTATITLYSSENLALQAGQPATAIFNASQVGLGALA